MAYKDILVYLDATEENESRLKLAVSIALEHGARLIGADASSPAAFEGKWAERAANLQALFEQAVGRAGLPGEFRSVRDASADNHRYAHYVDLIITPQLDDETRGLVQADIPEGVLVTAGRPMLLLPNAWPSRSQDVGKNVVIAWNASREATRAVHDALPFLRRAKKVTIFSFGPDNELFRKQADLLADHLKRHEVPAEAAIWTDTGELTPVEALFASLDTEDADMIVAGAYSRARWIEGLFGGATRDLIQQPSLPVLMSH
jgi:nucleotide-binding universal stress UspA family protein